MIRRQHGGVTQSPQEGRRLQRLPAEGVVGGVCAGLAVRFGLDTLLVRVAVLVAAVVTGGIAALGYMLLWVVLPTPPVPVTGPPVPDRTRRRHNWLVATGVGLCTLGALFIGRELGIWWSDALVWPLVLATAGVALIWRRFGAEPEPEVVPEGQQPSREQKLKSRFGPYGGGFGIALLIGAALLFLYVSGALEGTGDTALLILTVIAVLALVLAPFWMRLVRNLAAERSERIRSQERADLAAHLHDSVLQTLTLVQKRADDPRQVATLARLQERELREWLSGRSPADRDQNLATSLDALGAEVEERHEVPIDVVTVGDRPLDEKGAALVAASREALTNAARYAADSGPITMYAQISDDKSQVFVHDRGRGFDIDSIPDDRRGVRDSILGRMERHGGKAVVRSTPGEGTEIELTMEY